ncbi:TPA: nucleotidyltransferase [Vibrio cholerae]|nr:nucleotidyltransferase [Vibrio cholerae]
MATTVIEAFNKFLADHVNLRDDETKIARASRDWLVGQICNFPSKVDHFPQVYTEKNIFFGSFARNTKKRPLDDIDIMICLNAQGSTYFEGLLGGISISVPEQAIQLRRLCNDGTDTLNSIKVVNKIVSALSDVPQYASSDTKRNQEAAVLSLTSYDWSYDIVPCFFTSPDTYGNSFYLIPDGSGSWKKTNPILDQNRTQAINANHNGNVLTVIRIMKYWNKRPTMPSMSSYLLEVMILNYYSTRSDAASEFVDLELPKIFEYIWLNVTNDVSDPKGIQGNINSLTQDERSKISTRAWVDKNKSIEARQFESDKDHRSSIKKWGEIFGSNFPDYG